MGAPWYRPEPVGCSRRATRVTPSRLAGAKRPYGGKGCTIRDHRPPERGPAAARPTSASRPLPRARLLHASARRDARYAANAPIVPPAAAQRAHAKRPDEAPPAGEPRPNPHTHQTTAARRRPEARRIDARQRRATRARPAPALAASRARRRRAGAAASSASPIPAHVAVCATCRHRGGARQSVTKVIDRGRRRAVDDVPSAAPTRTSARRARPLPLPATAALKALALAGRRGPTASATSTAATGSRAA